MWLSAAVPMNCDSKMWLSAAVPPMNCDSHRLLERIENMGL